MIADKRTQVKYMQLGCFGNRLKTWNTLNAAKKDLDRTQFNNTLYEYEITITNVDYNDIIKLYEMMSMNSDEWNFLKELIEI